MFQSLVTYIYQENNFRIFYLWTFYSLGSKLFIWKDKGYVKLYFIYYFTLNYFDKLQIKQNEHACSYSCIKYNVVKMQFIDISR